MIQPRKVYVGDTGTLIRFMFEDPLPSGASAVIRYRKPSGSTGEWPATITAGTAPYTHFVEYTVQSGDLDEAGTWRLHVKLTSPSWSGLSNKVDLRVYSEFE